MSSFPSSACVPTALPLAKTNEGNPCTPFVGVCPNRLRV